MGCYDADDAWPHHEASAEWDEYDESYRKTADGEEFQITGRRGNPSRSAASRVEPAYYDGTTDGYDDADDSEDIAVDGAGVEWTLDQETGWWWWRDDNGEWQDKGRHFTPHDEEDTAEIMLYITRTPVQVTYAGGRERPPGNAEIVIDSTVAPVCRVSRGDDGPSTSAASAMPHVNADAAAQPPGGAA